LATLISRTSSRTSFPIFGRPGDANERLSRVAIKRPNPTHRATANRARQTIAVRCRSRALALALCGEGR
jgi:hypothetical protein